MIEKCEFQGASLRILDIGGGAGIIAAEVCRFLSSKGFQVECCAFDLSPEMLAAQKSNNPFNTLATSEIAQIRSKGKYDLVLLIDVIEHIPDNGAVAEYVDQLARYVLYNIPTENNLFDWLRNIYMRRKYYALQMASLGHVHFFSCLGAKRFVCAHHRFITSIFPDYPGHLLDSDFPDYVMQRSNRLRALELSISRFIYKRLRWLAPWLIQGSLFILAESRSNLR